MNKYDSDYFFILKKQDDRLPFLVPDKNTEDRSFSFEEQPVGSPPLVFHNGWKIENKRDKILGLTPEVLFSGSDLVVKKTIRDRLLENSISNLNMHPAVYIDDNEKWYEDYWYLTFTKRFDCWDRHTSDYSNTSTMNLNNIEYYKVFNFSLDEEKIETTTSAEKALFKMGGSIDALVTCHKSLVSVFSSGANGTEIIPITEFG